MSLCVLMCPNIRIGSSHGFQGDEEVRGLKYIQEATPYYVDIILFFSWFEFDFVLIYFNNLINDESINAKHIMLRR